MDLLVTTIAERPDLAPLLDRFPADASPEFMYSDPVAGLHYGHVEQCYREYTLVAIDRDHPELPVAKAYSTPFSWDGDLPDAGRAGGQIVSVAPCSMTIPGTLASWRTWTGLPFDTTGPVTVPGALAPVHCDVEADHAVYVEPNVWIRHRALQEASPATSAM